MGVTVLLCSGKINLPPRKTQVEFYVLLSGMNPNMTSACMVSLSGDLNLRLLGRYVHWLTDAESVVWWSRRAICGGMAHLKHPETMTYKRRELRSSVDWTVSGSSVCSHHQQSAVLIWSLLPCNQTRQPVCLNTCCKLF